MSGGEERAGYEWPTQGISIEWGIICPVTKYDAPKYDIA